MFHYCWWLIYDEVKSIKNKHIHTQHTLSHHLYSPEQCNPAIFVVCCACEHKPRTLEDFLQRYLDLEKRPFVAQVYATKRASKEALRGREIERKEEERRK